MAQMGIESLKANLNSPARTFLWDVLIAAPVGGGGSTETLALRCQTTNLPGRDVEDILIRYKQTGGVRFHGKLEYDHNWELTFIEGEDRAIFQTFYNWCQKVIHDANGVGIPDPETKVDMVLSMLKVTGDEWLRIKLIGCYIKSIGNVALSYEENAVVRFTVTVSYDRWEQAGV